MNGKLKKTGLMGFFIILLVLLGLTYSLIFQNKSKVELYFKHNDSINMLSNYNSYFDSFLEEKREFMVFDVINHKIKDFENLINDLIQEAKSVEMENRYINTLLLIRTSIEEKKIWIERYKARKAVESKILFFILNNSTKEGENTTQKMQNFFNTLRVELLKSIQMDSTKDVETLGLYNIDESNKDIQNLLNQAKALKENINFQKHYLDSAKNEKIDSYLKEAKENLAKQRIATNEFFLAVLHILVFLIIVFTFELIYFFMGLTKTKEQLKAFRNAVENSDNVVVIADKNSKILFVNDTFEKVSGYTKEMVIGQNPNILKSGLHDEEFYKNLNTTIYSGKTWQGRFVNKKQNGEYFYENATITPIFSEGEIDGYLAIKLDVTESVLHALELDQLNKSLEKRVEESLAKLREKDNLIFNQTKMAALGEMIANIAHQWRQPLSIISTSATGLQVQKEYGYLSDEMLDKSCNIINENAQYLSKTIDDFRNFIKGKSKKELFNPKEAIDSFLNLVDSSIKKYQIEMVLYTENDIQIYGLKNEFKQCLINLFNNSKDNFIEKKMDKKYIKIELFQKEKKVYLVFHDNGGGICENIIDKIFEPYFTTKHQSIGTGLGLNIVYRLITESMKGSISVSNQSFKVGDDEYFGAKFLITIPY